MRMSFDLLHELSNTEVFCLFHNCMWQSRNSEVNVYFSRAVWTNMLVIHSQVSPFLLDLRLRFRLCLCLYLRHTTLAEWWSIHRSLRSWVCAFAAKQDIFSDLLSKQNQMVAHSSQVSPFLIIGFLMLVGFVVSFHYLQQFVNPLLSSNCL